MIRGSVVDELRAAKSVPGLSKNFPGFSFSDRGGQFLWDRKEQSGLTGMKNGLPCQTDIHKTN